MLSSGTVLTIVLIAGFIFSLFSQNIALASDSLEISTLVAPVPTEPKPEPEPEAKPERSTASSEVKLAERTDNIRRMEENPTEIPDKVNVEKTDVKARPNNVFKISDRNFDPVGQVSGTGRSSDDGKVSGTGIKNEPTVVESDDKEEEAAPPPIKPKVEKNAPPKSLGVINGKATNLVTPAYPASAKSMGIKGVVKVQVLIDENGNVISAAAVEGHPLLRGNAVNAARSSKFSPTYLSNEKIKVTGVIIYNFS